MSNAIFTICSRNYLGQASALMTSVREHEPESSRYIVIVDRRVDLSEFEPGVAELIWVEDLDIVDIEFRAFIFDVLEFNTNIKPTAIRFLLRKNYDHCVYLDPDTFLYSSLSSVWTGLESANIVVTPHVINPDMICGISMQQDQLRHGGFNLGFIGVNNTAEADRFLLWWESRCLNYGFNAPADGLYVDQKFIDHAHMFFDGVKVLRHPGLNVAYWNLHERPLTSNQGKYFVSGDQLIFMHFSGFIYSPKNADEFNMISKYPSSVNVKSCPELIRIFEDYRSKLRACGYDKWVKLPYSYNSFDNGVQISRLARRLVGMSVVSISDTLHPFSSVGSIYKSLNDAGALDSFKPSFKSKISARNRQKEALLLKRGLVFLRWLYRRIGVARYEVLLKFFGYAASTLNQGFIINRK